MGKAGTRDDVKYWLDNALRPIRFYPDRLENDEIRIGLEAFGQVIPGRADAAAGWCRSRTISSPAATPRRRVSPPAGTSQRWPTPTATALIDIMRHVGGNDPAGGFEVLQQTPQWGDELIAVTDEATAWPVLSIDYSSEWSDRPEVNDSYQCTLSAELPEERPARRARSDLARWR